MSDSRSKRNAALIQIFSGIGMGLLVGIIVGLSVSEVVSIILGALAALLAAFLGVQDHQSSKTEQVDTTVINKSIMTGLRAGSFGISCVVAILFGIFLRTHNVLSVETSLKEQINVWTEAGYDTTEARQYVVYENLGILPKTMQITTNASVELKGKSGLSALFSNENDVNYCDLLSFKKNQNSVDMVIQAYRQTKQEELVNFANELENHFPKESQKFILLEMEKVFCEVQESINQIKASGADPEHIEKLIKSLQELLRNL